MIKLLKMQNSQNVFILLEWDIKKRPQDINYTKCVNESLQKNANIHKSQILRMFIPLGVWKNNQEISFIVGSLALSFDGLFAKNCIIGSQKVHPESSAFE
jgi:hypothetical protein